MAVNLGGTGNREASHKGSVSSFGTTTSQTPLLTPGALPGGTSADVPEGGAQPAARTEAPDPQEQNANTNTNTNKAGAGSDSTSTGASAKKKWNKVKLGIKFTAKIKPKADSDAKTVPDIEYLLVSFLPPSVCFKEIFQTLSRFVEIDKNTNTASDNPFSSVNNVRRVPNLKSEKTADGAKLERASVIVELNRALVGGREPAIDPETGEKGEEDRTLLVSFAFTTDPFYSTLCEAKKDSSSPLSESELHHLSTFDRVFSLNPKVLVMRQRCLSDQPFEVKAWVKNFKWAFPQRPEDTFVKLDKDDMEYLNNFVAQCLHQDIKRRILGRIPTAAKVIQIQPNGDWRLAHFDTM